jgi:hypothetical protein
MSALSSTQGGRPVPMSATMPVPPAPDRRPFAASSAGYTQPDPPDPTSTDPTKAHVETAAVETWYEYKKGAPHRTTRGG